MVSAAAQQCQGPGFNSSLGSLSVQSFYILPVSVWVFSRCSGFLLQSKDVPVRWIGHDKLPLGIRGYHDTRQRRIAEQKLIAKFHTHEDGLNRDLGFMSHYLSPPQLAWTCKISLTVLSAIESAPTLQH